MAWIGFVIASIFIWSIFGLMIICAISKRIDYGMNVENFEAFNPKWVYNNFSVNWFGCIILTLIINLACPVGSIIFWFYKLCTIGRK